ncbi:MAG TPA: family 20 glycosylhydrolase [Candidatus Eisenbergiella merdavium]|uniref:Family 20 glycosylhydrolase n=1 Tax=Candidatus Eisenbergiella merdavium TaxID=2838551 RepID=A0A9D2NFK8_9FIRM|nr:family 20 glycosylhydrolase [Candidatus Eisenbergiella merdavium]
MYLIPAPTKLEEKEGSFLLTCETYLIVEPSCSWRVTGQAELFNAELKKILGYRAVLTRGRAKKEDVVIRLDPAAPAQSYILDIREDGITLSGGEQGLWHGMQTLRQILEQKGALLPCLHIEDRPDILNRGFYFDCTRGRIPKLEWLKELVDRMAYYKLNQLQLYIEHTYLFRGMTELWRDDTPLTAAEIMELDRYCLERGVELVPSLSSFGHLYKLLSTKEYAGLCELENAQEQPFSVRGRMTHHTINAADPESLTLIRGMIGEFMELFSSRQFNFCADETFDLGTGRAKKLVEEKGKDQVYTGFIRELAQFLVENGRRPMFWGDIIWEFPEKIREMPEETICLNWGYAWDQSEEPTRRMYEAGAVQYCCPGCCSWNELVPLNWNAYNNIKRMCTYAGKYGAIGVLNTDWGDYLHVSHPDFSAVGMIYGAAFSWNLNIPEYEEINRQISRIEYHDASEKLLETLAAIQGNTAFEWHSVCGFWEVKRGLKEFEKEYLQLFREELGLLEDVDAKNERLLQIERELYARIVSLDSDRRDRVMPYAVAVRGIRLFNEAGKAAAADAFGCTFPSMPDGWKLAKELETWLYHYKEVYRRISRESELRRIEALVCWYGDFLREG